MVAMLISLNKPKWWIPYNFIASSEINNLHYIQNTHADGWLSKGEHVIMPNENRNWTGSKWVLFNKQFTGYYLVNYSKDNWIALIEGLSTKNAGNVHYLDRLHLIENAFELAESGIISYEIPLKLLTYFPHAIEMDSLVCSFTYITLMNIESRIKNFNFYNKFQVM